MTLTSPSARGAAKLDIDLTATDHRLDHLRQQKSKELQASEISLTQVFL